MCIYDCMWNPTVRLLINRFLYYPNKNENQSKMRPSLLYGEIEFKHWLRNTDNRKRFKVNMSSFCSSTSHFHLQRLYHLVSFVLPHNMSIYRRSMACRDFNVMFSETKYILMSSPFSLFPCLGVTPLICLNLIIVI